MPKVTSHPSSTSGSARWIASWKAATSAMTWSDGMTSIGAVGSSAASAASAIAGAVFRPIGSRMIEAGAVPASASCASIWSTCIALATTIGAAKCSPASVRRAVSCSIVSSAVSARNCLGSSGRDIGHNLVPDPPDRMTGTISFVSDIDALPPRRRMAVVSEPKRTNARKEPFLLNGPFSFSLSIDATRPTCR